MKFGTTADFKGFVLAKAAIQVFANATVEGRLLSQTAVTLIASQVKPPE
ncbi:MAG: hypothetical protein ACI9V8_001494 [Urechidicola sp.]